MTHGVASTRNDPPSASFDFSRAPGQKRLRRQPPSMGMTTPVTAS
jgi:hypothetical protein